jgi:hypothetical protein
VRAKATGDDRLRDDALVAWLLASDADRASADVDGSVQQSADEGELSAESLDEFFAALSAF